VGIAGECATTTASGQPHQFHPAGVPVAQLDANARRSYRDEEATGMNKVAGVSWVSALILLVIIVIALVAYNR
jgi:hypothetical protein